MLLNHVSTTRIVPPQGRFIGDEPRDSDLRGDDPAAPAGQEMRYGSLEGTNS
jgi:hypothetical protein